MLIWQLQHLGLLIIGTSLRSERKVTLCVKYIQYLELKFRFNIYIQDPVHIDKGI